MKIILFHKSILIKIFTISQEHAYKIQKEQLLNFFVLALLHCFSKIILQVHTIWKKNISDLNTACLSFINWYVYKNNWNSIKKLTPITTGSPYPPPQKKKRKRPSTEEKEWNYLWKRKSCSLLQVYSALLQIKFYR